MCRSVALSISSMVLIKLLFVAFVIYMCVCVCIHPAC